MVYGPDHHQASLAVHQLYMLPGEITGVASKTSVTPTLGVMTSRKALGLKELAQSPSTLRRATYSPQRADLSYPQG